MDQNYDIIVLGGGIAAMTAGIYASQANLKTLILEKSICGGLVNTTYLVENFPSQPRIAGQELMEKVRDQVDAMGVDIREVIEVDRLSLEGDIKTVETDEGIFTADVVILATGRTPRPLPINTECEQVHYCAICDGSGYKGKNFLVVGGGNSGIEESVYLLSLGVRHITVIEQMDRLFASQQAQTNLLGHQGQVDIFTDTRVKELEIENNKLVSVLLYNAKKDEERRLKADGIFVYMGHDTQTALFKETISLNKYGYIDAGDDLSTNIPGVFAAGDLVQKKYCQITTAMSDGTIAALSAAEYIRKKHRHDPAA
ncbi:MAG: NAD(P)/FAD-dependent oxidoreductase [Desulfobacter sp.]|nr:MAG: NAD(P)/FAD-dependent oxidoreductase [Desulfobacter sp.]